MVVTIQRKTNCLIGKLSQSTPQKKKSEKALAKHWMSDKRNKPSNDKICAEEKENYPS
jgi:hypothetical protein